MVLAPIILFVYNRPWHTEQTLTALQNNELADQSILYIYTDGAKSNASVEDLAKIQEVKQIIRKDWGFKEVHVVQRERNWGLADNIVDGISQVIQEHGKIIVLEDDIVTAKGFLTYMNDALSLYEHDEKVMHISGYMFPVKRKLPQTFFYNTASCWGWGTWKNAWKHYHNDASELLDQFQDQAIIQQFNVEGSYDFFGQLKANVTGEIKTWAVKWYASFFLKNGFALHPYPSLTNNIGHDGFGENCQTTTVFDWKILADQIQVDKQKIQEHKKAREAVRIFNTYQMNQSTSHSPLQRLVSKTKSILSLIVPDVLKHYYRLNKYPEYKEADAKDKLLQKVKQIPRFQEGTIRLKGNQVKFIDSASFLFIYDEIFQKEIYKFKAKRTDPYIIDAGANIGLAIIYFKQLYPEAEIVAFEPDQKAFDALQFNVNSFNLQKTTLVNKALWHQETVLEFMSEGADGGRIATNVDTDQIVTLPTTRLRQYLDRSKEIDLLKIDIEGAETKVLEDCQDLLINVDKLFVEYHSFATQEQELHQLLNILYKAGFRYIVQHIGVFSPNPFITVQQYLNMDLQLNIFAFRP